MNYKFEAEKIIKEVIEKCNLTKGDILVIGFSSSEVVGSKIGTNSNIDVASEIFNTIYNILRKKGIYLAVQCCEHLNRAIVTEKNALKYYYEPVNVVPQKKAGGSFATIAYEKFDNPVVLEEIKADAGLDVGDTFIGMHLKKVAVPVRLSVNTLGEAHVTCARTRLKFIGGERAVYDKTLL